MATQQGRKCFDEEETSNTGALPSFLLQHWLVDTSLTSPSTQKTLAQGTPARSTATRFSLIRPRHCWTLDSDWLVTFQGYIFFFNHGKPWPNQCSTNLTSKPTVKHGYRPHVSLTPQKQYAQCTVEEYVNFSCFTGTSRINTISYIMPCTLNLWGHLRRWENK